PILASEKTTLTDLIKSFDIETVTDEFFQAYKNLYLQLEISLAKHQPNEEFKNKKIASKDFAKQLLGQIVFLYFLQKKGWLGVEHSKAWGTGPKNFLQQLYNQHKDKNFFNDILEHLFYDALAKPKQNESSPLIGYKIPFLNGGLFEPFKGYDWKKTDILLDNNIFEKIFQVFDRYNFTVREDEPLDKEVAIDPEMLGKVFENLIPENEKKGSGTFYTPREIVHYMCQESLINYLDAKLNIKKHPIQTQKQPTMIPDQIPTDMLTKYEYKYQNNIKREDIENFIYYGDSLQEHDTTAYQKNQNENYQGSYQYKIPETIRHHAEKIDNALASIKICDPAIGSGAFPVGIMNEIVRARSALTAHLKNENRNPYHFKRHAIQESIYGVDSEPSAVDIAKLRLWLSLIVDEESYENIQPLPNLDYKIFYGDSLTRKINIDDLADKGWLEDLIIEQNKIFDETNPEKKYAIKQKIDGLLENLFQGEEDEFKFNYWVQFYNIMKDGGFDIIIANPPYGLINKKQNQNFAIILSDKKLKSLKNNPEFKETNYGMLNFFQFFVVRGLNLLKPNGIFCQIYPLAFIADRAFYKLRKKIIDDYDLIGIETFPERNDEKKRVFKSAKVSVCITMVRNSQIQNDFFLRIHTDRFVDTTNQKISFTKNNITTLDPHHHAIPLFSLPKEKQLIVKVFSHNKKLSDIGHCYEGELHLTIHKEFFSNNPDDYKLHKGAIIDRYLERTKMSQGEIVFCYPTFLKRMPKNRLSHFSAKRIVMQGIGGTENIRLKMNIIEPNIICGNSLNYLYFNDKYTNLESMLALMNSTLMNFIFKKFNTNSNISGYEINNLPIPDLNKTTISSLAEYAGKLRHIYRQPSPNKTEADDIETKIDRLVYQSFKLNEDDINIIEQAESKKTSIKNANEIK
ncbi:MAG: Eco57I restriction-modification methylase domain-containing protein, partial [Alphaproteobacteria bacterium]